MNLKNGIDKIVKESASNNVDDYDLEELIDNIYENGIDYDEEYESPTGHRVYFSKSPAYFRRGDPELNVSVTMNDEELDSWDEFIPNKRARMQGKADLLKKLRQMMGY